jgi:hypothetical protein
MNVPIGIEGQIKNSERPAHRVLVQDDSENTGGFIVFEWWNGSNGPNHNAAFDSWVEDKVSLSAFFEESGWLVDWQSNPNLDTDASRRSN